MLIVGGAAAALAATPAGAQARRPSATLSWRGSATMVTPTGPIELIVQTELSLPELSVRSSSWLAAEGPGTTRTLLIEPGGAWVERGGARQPLPAAMAAHERQQFALYAYLWLVQLGDAPAAGVLDLAEPGYPPVRLTIGGEGLPSAAWLSVDALEAGRPPIAERALFTDWSAATQRGRGLRWPQHILIEQDGRRWFDLRIEQFRAE